MTNTQAWQPSATIAVLKQRANVLAKIRHFFKEREVMEVDVPVLSHCSVSDPFIDAISASYRHYPQDSAQQFFLQSSPEYAMKRLLAAGSGCIYQMAKVFRNGEVGRKHNPEFTMLEWYRIGFDEQQLMAEVAALVTAITGINTFEKLTYQQAFIDYLGVDITTVNTATLEALMRSRIEIEAQLDRDGWLNLLMSHCIEPQLKGAVFIYDYPASQAALAKLKKNTASVSVAARFEFFINGVELANGYHELTNATEQAQRFAADMQQRKELDLPQNPTDQRLVAALESGMPECAGVALGIDRLLMIALDKQHISEVLPFDFSRA